MFEVLDVLDCRGNRLVALPTIRLMSNGEERPTLPSVKEVLIDERILGLLTPSTNDNDSGGGAIRNLCPAAAGFNCGPLYNRGCDDDDVDGNEEEGLEHEEELVGESSEEAIESLEQELRDVFSRAERKKNREGIVTCIMSTAMNCVLMKR